MAGDKYDIFISYAREDLEWVEENLHAPLQRCRLKDGRTPRIFFDIGHEGIAIGEMFPLKIADAIKQAPRVVPVYSANYFRKEMCIYELSMAHQCDVLGKKRKLNPILLDPQYAGQVPFAVSLINFWTVSDPNWFERLCTALEVTPATVQPQLEFQTRPTTAMARLTLAPVKVAIKVGGLLRMTGDDEITISAEGAELQGTLKQKTATGVATFSDLIVASSATGVRLVATTPGSDSVRSEPFDVQAPPPPPKPEAPPTITVEGEAEAVFFANGRAVLLFRPGTAAVYSLSGLQLSPDVSLYGRVRIVSRSEGMIVVADWSGNVWLFSDTGQHKSWAFGGGKGGFVVPGGVAFDGQTVYVGFWSGLVFRVSLDGSAQEALRHEAGVQALAVVGGRCYVADFGGALAVYNLATQQLVNSGSLEKSIWMLRPVADGLLAVGDEFVYQISPSPLQIHREVLPAGATAGVFADSARPVLVGDDGAGLRVNSQLVFRPRFRVAPGAVPVGADERGSFCICVSPDGGRTMLRDNKVIYSHPNGTLAVSPNGDLFALGERGGVRVVAAAGFAPVQGGGA